MRRPDDTGGVRGPTRRGLLAGLAAGTLSACGRYDATSWFTRVRYDVDRRFTESTDELSHPPAPSIDEGDPWSMLVISDIHSWGEVPSTLDDVRRYLDAAPVDLVFCLGDLADAGYPRGFLGVLQGLDELGAPVFTAFGNHDSYNEGWAHYRDLFGASAYELHVAGSTLVVPDTAGATLGGLQRPWLERRLAEAAGRSRHLIVLTHYPLWVGRLPNGDTMGSQQETYDILDLLRRYGVDAHISGHTHRWAHTEVDGVQLYTVSSMREEAGDRTALRVDVQPGLVEYTRVDFGS